MVRSLPDTNIPIPRSKWTVGDAAAHIAATQALYKEGLEGAKSPYGDGRLERFAPVNVHQLQHFPERNARVLAELIEQRTERLLETAAKHQENLVIDYHFGPMDLTEWLSYCLTHLLMHGCAMAYALKQKLPIEPHHVELTLPFMKAVIPRVFDETKAGNMRATFEFRFTRDVRLWVTIDRGKAVVENERPRRISCHIGGSRVAMFLVLLGIRSQWPMIAQGKLLAWGRRPWLAFGVKRLFPNP
ncbi:MAG: DinB family protein [Actinomycetota bacterium]|nr:DinB family protein [Actinomycetota bacterium]